MSAAPVASQGQPKSLLHVFPTFAVGGAQMRFGQLVGAHGDRYRHKVLSLDGKLDMAVRIPAGPQIHYQTLPAPERGTVRSVLNARRWLARSNPDILVTYNWGSMNWCLANHWNALARHIHIEDGFGPEEQANQLPRRVRVRRLALNSPNTTIIVPSRRLEAIAKNIWRLPPEKVHYIPNGIDYARFAAAGANRIPHRPVLTLGTVATLRQEKNIGRLIRLFSGLSTAWPNLHLLIVGDGPERAALETFAAKGPAASRITFTGATAQPEIEFARMDLFALTSMTEQMPLSVLEAMASGLPVLSLDVGDVSDMVSPGNKPFVVPDSDEALRKAADRLLASSELRKNLGLTNQAVAKERFDEPIMAARYAEIFG